jgi:hypothetical protein
VSVSDKLQLIQALEERERASARRGGLIAWASVALAALVLAVMIGAASNRLAGVREQVKVAEAQVAENQRKLADSNALLAANEARLATVRSELADALPKLESLGGAREDVVAVESAFDSVLAASTAAGPAPVARDVPPASSGGRVTAPAGNVARGGGGRRGTAGGAQPAPAPPPPPAVSAPGPRADAIAQLFDPSGAVRVRAYGALLPRYANDSSLVPEILAAAKQHPGDANGTYNALVVLSHMNATSLRPYRQEIVAFAESSQRIGPRVAERARTLISRVPQ